MQYPTLAGGTCQATRITHIIVTLCGTHMDKMYEITVANRNLPEVAGYRPVVLYIAVRATAFATTITHEQSFQQTEKRQGLVFSFTPLHTMRHGTVTVYINMVVCRPRRAGRETARS